MIGFYVLTNRAMYVTRGNLKTPTQYPQGQINPPPTSAAPVAWWQPTDGHIESRYQTSAWGKIIAVFKRGDKTNPHTNKGANYNTKGKQSPFVALLRLYSAEN